jgi:hypothetical protein
MYLALNLDFFCGFRFHDGVVFERGGGGGGGGKDKNFFFVFGWFGVLKNTF